MIEEKVELLVHYWAIAGYVDPCSPHLFSSYSLRERAEAASRAGFRGMGLLLEDLKHSIEKFTLSGVKQILQDTGMKYVELECLVDWYGTGERRAVSDRYRRDVIELGGALGIRNLKALSDPLEEGPADLPKMTEEFAHLCQDIAEINATVGLELAPFSIVRSIKDGLAVVEAAGRPNGGLMLDLWCVVRGGDGNSEVGTIPSGYIKGIELVDGEAQAVGTLSDDNRFHRRLCGEGSFDCRGFIEAVRRSGFSAPYYGVEPVFGTYPDLTLEEMCKRAYDTTIAQFPANSEVPDQMNS